MPATIVVGGQYGSEGKGKVAALVAQRSDHPWLVRCGGPNSGHTVTVGGRDVILRQVPCSTDPTKPTFCLAAGCAIDVEVLLREVDLLGIEKQRILIDPRAIIITEEDREVERLKLKGIASTCSGTGAALIRRMARDPGTVLAAHSDALRKRCRVEPVAPMLHDGLHRGADVIVEGTQGFGLSLLHGFDYPFVTSRDTTASAFAAEVGLSPRLISNIVMVIRTFPIRVGGSSGPFPNEITWDEIASASGAPLSVPELTSVTKKVRRVAKFDLEAVRIACEYNRPSSLAVMGLDRLDYLNTGVLELAKLTPLARGFLNRLETVTGVPVTLVGTGFSTHETIKISPELNETALAHA